ncbi:MAG: M48 family metallopeptidase [Erysipelotrichaceae bacterium]|nr:M48 family metallopeptidase [Erysipelotrichaceae bacterium]
MKVEINNQLIDVFVIKKRQKNTYLRVKEDGIYITTNYLTTNKYILNLLRENENKIIKMQEHLKKKQEYNQDFFYLGKKYNIVKSNLEDIVVGDSTILVRDELILNKWLVKQARIIFKENLDEIYKIFPVEIPYPSLTIRKMKTRWGVCNTRIKKITLNLELIKKDKKYLDYVIVHELSHLVYPNHGSDFWHLVSILVPNYKILRKELNSYE